ncbi:MAG: hypothetical protein L0387_30365 [Acidobacteria bacterium]|nr:hypothetical protein [Acidobacteriota bacterium]
MEEFAKFEPTDLYDPKRIEEYRELERQGKALDEQAKAAGLDVSPSHFTAKQVSSLLAFIHVKFPTHNASFTYEENTRFLERIAITPNRPKQ